MAWRRARVGHWGTERVKSAQAGTQSQASGGEAEREPQASLCGTVSVRWESLAFARGVVESRSKVPEQRRVLRSRWRAV